MDSRNCPYRKWTIAMQAIIVNGTAEEIAALVVALQERREANRPEVLSSELLTGPAVHLSGEKVGRNFLTTE